MKYKYTPPDAIDTTDYKLAYEQVFKCFLNLLCEKHNIAQSNNEEPLN